MVIREASSISSSDLAEKLIRRPIYNAWSVVIRFAENELNEIWDSEITSRYVSQFEGRYPFSMEAVSQAPLGDFEEFFGHILPAFKLNILNHSWISRAQPSSMKNTGLLLPSEYGGLRFSLGQQQVLKRGLELGRLIGIKITVIMKSNPDRVRLNIGEQDKKDSDLNDEGEIRSYTWPSEPVNRRIT